MFYREAYVSRYSTTFHHIYFLTNTSDLNINTKSTNQKFIRFAKKSQFLVQTIIDKSGIYSITKALYIVFREASWKEQAFEKLCRISDYLIHSRGYQEWK